MGKFSGSVTVGLRDKETNKLIAVYPKNVEGDYDTIKSEVKDWYYKQDCGNEDLMRNYFVDTLTENELKALE
jgi:hypothetical protein